MGFLDDLYLNVYETPAGGAWSGSDSADAVSYWLASDPLVEQQGGATWAANGSPTISSLRGADCFTTATGTGYARSTSCLADLAEGETATIYLLMEAPTGVAVSFATLSAINSNPAGEYLQVRFYSTSTNYAIARDGGNSRTDTQGSASADTVYVIALTVREQVGGTSWEVEASRDATSTGSPSGATGDTPNTMDGVDEINNGGGALSPYGESYRIWARLVTKADFNSAIPAELVAAVGVS